MIKMTAISIMSVLLLFSCKSRTVIVPDRDFKNNKTILFDGTNDNETIVREVSGESDIERLPGEEKSSEEIEEELRQLYEGKGGKYRIQPGDTFNIYVDADPNFNTENAFVKTDGYISIRRLGEVKIEELSIEEAKKAIEKRLGAYMRITPKLSLIPVKLKESRINILGEVNRPGSYVIEGKMRILDAIAMAGGIAFLQHNNERIQLAELKTAYIYRQERILPVNFEDLLVKGNILHNIVLEDQDYIFIPTVTRKKVFVLGQVGYPGKFLLTDELSLTKLLAMSQGLRDSASNYIFIIRGNLYKPVVYKVPYNSILSGRMKDFALKDNDIVYVPKSAITKYNEVINNILPTLNLLNLSAGTYLNGDNIRRSVEDIKSDYFETDDSSGSLDDAFNNLLNK